MQARDRKREIESEGQVERAGGEGRERGKKPIASKSKKGKGRGIWETLASKRGRANISKIERGGEGRTGRGKSNYKMVI